MKTLKNKFWALLLIGSVTLLSCKKENPLSPLANVKPASTTTADAAYRNEWKITTYQIGKVSNVKLFESYTFSFADDGVILVSTNNNSEKGSWVVEDKMMNLEFSSNPLNELNKKDWKILSNVANDLKLEAMNRNNELVSLSFHRDKLPEVKTLGAAEVDTDAGVPVTQ